jgi:hypothetical protein
VDVGGHGDDDVVAVIGDTEDVGVMTVPTTVRDASTLTMPPTMRCPWRPIRVFSASLEEFQRKVMTNQIFRDLEAGFRGVVGHTVARSEASSWRGSLPRLEAALRLAELRGDVHVTLEERIPYFSKRMDACLFGHDQEGSPYTVVVELKGWTEAEARDDVSVETFLGGAERIEPHPSAQVQGYHQHLVDYRRAFHSPGALSIASCAYCHNYPGIEPDEGLFHPRFDALRDHSPTFGERDAEILAKYLRVRLERGHGSAVLDVYDRRGVGPSKSLVDHADRMIREQGVFRLLDEQLVANSAIMRALKTAAHKRRRKQVILVRGGPGTGKSVIALNALGEMLRQGLHVYLVSGSSAFTHGLRRILGKRLEGQVRFTDFFWDADPDSIDCLVIDEAPTSNVHSRSDLALLRRAGGHDRIRHPLARFRREGSHDGISADGWCERGRKTHRCVAAVDRGGAHGPGLRANSLRDRNAQG